MKRGTPEHPKTIELAARLPVQRWGAVGLLEMLWHATAQHQPDGGIGRWSNVRIARALYWRGDPDRLVEALVAAGWLDPHPTARLMVHDWSLHLDQATKRKLSRAHSGPLTPDGYTLTSHDYPVTSQKLAMSGPPEPEPEPEKKKISPKVPSKRALAMTSHAGTRVPDPFPLSDEYREAAITLGLGAERVDGVWAEFCDYWRGLPGAHGRRSNWLAVWRNNVRRVLDRIAPARRNGHGPPTEPDYPLYQRPPAKPEESKP